MSLARVRPTRVYRFYRGGALIDRLRGEPERDGEYPEDWIGSVVSARNAGRDEPEAGLTRLEAGRLLGSLHRLVVRPGDIVFVPAGVPHALGAGALIVELQEPTDFSVICEWKGFPIDPENTHLGLGWDRALEALRLEAFEPELGLPDAARAFFQVDDRAEPAGRFAVLLVLEGEGELDGQPARAGDAFVIPAAAEAFDVRGDLRILRCMGGTS